MDYSILGQLSGVCQTVLETLKYLYLLTNGHLVGIQLHKGEKPVCVTCVKVMIKTKEEIWFSME